MSRSERDADFFYPLPRGVRVGPNIGAGLVSPPPDGRATARRLTPEERAAIAAEVRAGAPDWRVARDHGITAHHARTLAAREAGA